MATRLKTNKYFTQSKSDENGFEVFVGPDGDPLNGVTIAVRRDRKGILVRVEKRAGWIRFISPSSSDFREFLIGAIPRLSWGKAIAIVGSILTFEILLFVYYLRLGL